jgi:type IV secretion system protein VirB9
LRFAALILALAFAATIANAQVRPTPGAGDPRIQTVTYDANQVVQLQVASGYQLSVEFGPDERIENIAVGDSGAWQVSPNKRGDHLFIKPLQAGAVTNLTVVTDARSYAFELMPAMGPGPTLPFTVRFIYPVAEAVPSASPARAFKAGRYALSGDSALRPSAMTDDGVHTTFTWPADRTMPAVFAIDDEGHETLVNGAVRDGSYVVDSVANRYRFRIDKHTAGAVRVPALDRP